MIPFRPCPGRFLCQPCCGGIDLPYQVRHPVVRHRDGIGIERVGLYYICPGFQEPVVYLTYNIRPCDIEYVVVALERLRMGGKDI